MSPNNHSKANGSNGITAPIEPDSTRVVGESPGSRSDMDQKAVLAVRNLVLDLCTQFGGGHGGSALGMAAIGVALWKYVLRYSPADPDWFDRDRFVLSNGRMTRNFSR